MIARRIAVSVLVAALLLGAGCVPAGVGTPEDVAPRVTVVAGTPPVDLDPYAVSLDARRIGMLVFRGLFRMGPDETPVPDLCLELPTRDNGGISSDGLEVTYRLRDDVLWHDGETVDADDVAFTLEALRTGALVDEPGAEAGLVTGVRVADGSTLVVTFAEPASFAAWRMVPFVLPEHLLADSDELALDGFWRAPVGSGPYRVERFVPGTEVALVPVSEESGALPLDVVFSSDPRQARQLFDGAPRAVWPDAPVGPASEAEGFDETPSVEWARFELNHRDGHVTADQAVREAIVLLAPTEGPVTPGPLGSPVPARAEPDIAGARAVLDAAGWRVGEDGVRERGGVTLRVHVVAQVLSTAQGDRIEALLLQWEEAGIQVRFTIAGDGLLGSYYDSQPIREDDWDIAWMVLPVGRPLGWAWPYRTGDEPSWERPWGLNLSGVDDPGLEELRADLAGSGTPAQASQAAALLSAGLDARATVAWEGSQPSRVLWHGVDGVRAETVPVQALLGATEWRAVIDASAGDEGS